MKWKLERADKFCKSVRDGTHDTPKQVDFGFKLITAKNIKNGQVDLGDAYNISEKDYIKINERSKVEKWDVLMSMIGNGLGRSAVIKDNPKYAIKNLALFKIGNEVKAKWLHYFLCSNEGQGIIFNTLQGSGQPFISLNLLRGLLIPVPPLTVMKKVIKILSLYDDLIENNQKQIKLLEEAAQRLYKEWFVDLRFPGYENTPIIDGVPKGWKKEDLINLVDIQYGYAFKGSLFNNIGKGMPIIRIRNIPDGQTTDFTTEKVSKEYIIHNGDILVGMDGEFYVNSWGGEDAYLVQRTCCFRPKFNNIKGYLLQAILEPIKFFEKTVVGATVTHLGKKHINTIKIFSVPNVLYEPFQMWYEKRQSLVNQNRLLTEARNRLISQIMGRKFII